MYRIIIYRNCIDLFKNKNLLRKDERKGKVYLHKLIFT